ncbi:type VI secretion system baseplate subunit TssF [Sphaerotilus sp.]|uniref:type VI secretion system baseplate subunit TssF n=1 Tax=Sphaerotilus sp. TaxID=2093942 RepID=UPI002ACE6078|nr:type VI secretion system baseplate subunit TssF [Sphaerotilus sp.]MDZ7856493.1 type VI secretion system baseplate subunit TssF [Sphaerotilus sp.]
MDPGLLRRYNEELAHLREVGAEFAREFPKIAGRLTMDGVEVADPYVERLLEGFAFMAARIQLKIDSEYPRLVGHLLETVCPNFVAPVPSMAVVRMQPDLLDPALTKGFAVPRGTALHSEAARGQNTRCEFRTAHAVTLWPLEIAAVQYFTHAPDLPVNRLPVGRQVRGGLRIRLRSHGVALNQLPLDTLAFYLSAADETALRLHELVTGQALGSWVVGGAAPAGPAQPPVDPRRQWRGAASVRALGFGDDEALLPETLRGFSGHRLLQEYAALPQRLLFFALDELRARLAPVRGNEAELVVLFGRGDPTLEAVVDREALALFCTPAINLFRKRLDRIAITPGTWEHHVVPDRTRPMDFEVHALDSVTGHGSGAQAQQTFLPLYAAFHTEEARHDAYYTVRREPRVWSERQRQQGPRTAFVGTECFLSLVDAQQAPHAADLRQLSVTAWVTNRDLPVLLPGAVQTAQTVSGVGGADAAGRAGRWTLEVPGPVQRVETLRGPTRPVQRLPRGHIGWSLVSLLSLDHLTIAGEDPRRAAAALRSLLLLFGNEADTGWRRWVEGLLTVEARAVTRRLPFSGPLTFGSGVAVTVEVDELAFQGGSAFLFGSVLERFFARHAAINSFTETTLRSTTRGELMRWPPRCGVAPLL